MQRICWEWAYVHELFDEFSRMVRVDDIKRYQCPSSIDVLYKIFSPVSQFIIITKSLILPTFGQQDNRQTLTLLSSPLSQE